MSISIETVDLGELDAAGWKSLTRRRAIVDPAVRTKVRAIVADVAARGDAALVEAGREFGGSPADGNLTRVQADFAAAVGRTDPAILRALRTAATAIEQVCNDQFPRRFTSEPTPGVTVETAWSPLRSVGAYVPGGTAAYPSSVLMTAIPARVAGVERVVVASPAGPEGSVDDAVLAACQTAGVDRLYVMGGAQAIAALAVGTESVDAVDKIVGPGNAWVTAAKLEVFGICGIDLPAGPSEALEIADDSADPRLVAADLLSQAEHGPDSIAVLVTTSESVARRALGHVTSMLRHLERAETIRAALEKNGLIAVATDLDQACRFADDFGPEHLGIHAADAEWVAAQVRSAGSVFVGQYAPHSAGDYATGANHVLPTGGLARTYGPLSVADFGSFRQIQRISQPGLAVLRETVSAIAQGEGLTAHRLAVDARFEEFE